MALATGFAGGYFQNFIQVPEQLKKISLFTPQGWVLDDINRLLADGGVESIILPVLVLLTISLILLPLSYIIISRSLRL